MKALVTGASGQLGHYLVPILRERGYEVVTERSMLFEYNLLSPDEVYVCHQVRNSGPQSYEHYMESVKASAEILETFRESKRVVFCGSIIQDLGNSPWHLSRQFTSRLVDQFPNAWMPKLPQFVSKWVNPKRQYTGQVLWELAQGIESVPADPYAGICIAHAESIARFLVNSFQDPLKVPFTEQLYIHDYISLAKTGGSWLNKVVEEIRERVCTQKIW